MQRKINYAIIFMVIASVVLSAQSATSVPDGFVRINGGTFTMGNPASEVPTRSSRSTERQVTVSGFLMGKHQVTQKEYEEIMGSNPSRVKGDPNLPVSNLYWFEAIEYCNKRSEQEGLTPAYTISGTGSNPTVTWDRDANGYRLPTEAEWEYACRAGTTTPFNTGNNITTAQANYNGEVPYMNNARGENRGRAIPVGSFPANAWGLYDMHGNVWEWCWDRLIESPPLDEQTDPVGPTTGSPSGPRVVRGGSFDSTGVRVRSAARWFGSPSSRVWDIGFRVVLP